jgi:ankyrin repeat protein
VATDEDFLLARDRADGTCLWFDSQPSFCSWLAPTSDNSAARVLWVKGIPGCGKTHLATRIIDKAQLASPTGYFFCKTSDKRKRDCLAIVRTWVFQLLQQREALLPHVGKVYKTGERPNVSNLTSVLDSMLTDEKSCRLVIDGLDECELEARKQIMSLCSQVSTKCRLVVLSRDMPDIALAMAKLSKVAHVAQAHITEKFNKQDINNFLGKQIQEELEPLGLDQFLLDYIAKKLSAGAHGMFLWVRLMIEHIGSQTSIADIESALEDLPAGLDELYEGMLAKIQNKAFAAQSLRWIVFSYRPLTITELDTAIAIDPGSSSLDQKRLALRPKETLRKVLGPLIEIDEATQTVRLIHASLKDFMSRGMLGWNNVTNFVGNSSEAHRWIARACLKYLNFPDRAPADVSSNDSKARRAYASYFKRNAMLSYSSTNWWQHILDGSMDSNYISPELEKELLKLVNSREKTVEWAQALRESVQDPLRHGLADQILEEMSAILPKLRSGKENFNNWVLNLRGDTHMRRSRLQTLLHGNTSTYECVAMLLDYDDIVQDATRHTHPDHIINVGGETLLHVAAWASSIETMRELLRRGASVNIESHFPRTALNLAVLEFGRSTQPAQARTFDAASMLLQAGANVEFWDSNGWTALGILCHDWGENEYTLDLAHQLLARGADNMIDHANSTGHTALHEAARWENPKTLKLLLDHGANVDGDALAVKKSGESPLHSASVHSKPEIVRILLEYGAAVNTSAPGTLTTPLHVASRHALQSVQLLLANGANMQMQDCDGWLPLHHAVCEDMASIVKVLLDHGSDLYAKDVSGKTPLRLAIECEADAAISIILEYLLRNQIVPPTLIEQHGIENLKSPSDIYARRRLATDIVADQSTMDMTTSSKRNPFHVLFLLQQLLRYSTPELLHRIMHLAEYWKVSSRTRTATVEIQNSSLSYIASYPITGCRRRPVEKIVFTIRSHDQGWSGWPGDHGTYRNTWTWFQTRVSKRRQPLIQSESWCIAKNLHARDYDQTHVVTWTASLTEEEERDGRKRKSRDWVRHLEIGDVVSIVACAQYGGWVNHVKSATIDIYTACV